MSFGFRIPDRFRTPDWPLTPRRVAYVVNVFPKLSETFIAHELAELRRRGVALRIISLRRPTEPLRHAVIARAGLDALTCYEPADFTAVLRDLRPQLIHAHFATEPAAAARGLAAELGVPFSFTAHGYDIRRKSPPDFAERAAAARAVITVSEANKHYIVETFGVPGERLHIIPCGVDTEWFRPAASPRGIRRAERLTVQGRTSGQGTAVEAGRAVSSAPPAHPTPQDGAVGTVRPSRRVSAQAQLCAVKASGFAFEPPHVGCGEEGPLLVCVARQVKVKNLGLLLEACALLRNQGVRFRCVLVGDGPCRGELEAECEQFGLDDVVTFTGAQEQAQVLAWWQQADLAVLTSENEGMPVCLMEAASCGVPAVATAVGGVPELIEAGVTGLLTPPGDALAFASAVQALLEQPSQAAEMGRAARRRAVERFSLTRQVDRLLRVWTEMLR
jgi:glycosyltransferase involved in cell wall biosynthesis